jgi:protease IV
MDSPAQHSGSVPPSGTFAAPQGPGSSRPMAGGGWWRWVVRLVVLACVVGSLGVVLLLAAALTGFVSVGDDSGITEQYHSLSRHAVQKVAIITLEGTILDGDGFVKRQIDHVRDDENVKAIVLRVNSPGGTVSGSDYIYHHLKRLAAEREIPLVVSMGGIAASGGYYAAMAVGDTPDSIFAEPTTWTGSIGVIIPHYNFAGLMETWRLEEDSIKSHRLKQMGSPTRAMTDEERKIFQALVDDSFARFKEIVAAGRPRLRNDPTALDKVSTGQVFTTRQALESGLVDKEGFVEDAIDRAIELAGLDRSETRAVKYKHFGGIFDLLLGAQSRERPPSAIADLAALLDMTSPRAYFLCTWLPRR